MDSTTDRLTRRSRAKRDQIRAAAQQLFLERGFANTGTNLIAREAGVSKETLYRYFPSKEALLADCLRHLIADVPENRLPVALGEAPLEDRDDLRSALLDLALRFVSNLMQPDYVALVRVIITETPRLPQLGSLFRSTVPERAFRSVIDILRMAQDKNLVRLPDLETAARMFLGPLLTYVLLDGLFIGEGPPRRPQPERIEAVVDLYIASYHLKATFLVAVRDSFVVVSAPPALVHRVLSRSSKQCWLVLIYFLRLCPAAPLAQQLVACCLSVHSGHVDDL